MGAVAAAGETLELTPENVEQVLDEVRPYLMADGGDVERRLASAIICEVLSLIHVRALLDELRK